MILRVTMHLNALGGGVGKRGVETFDYLDLIGIN
jgi:hypothetical protein